MGRRRTYTKELKESAIELYKGGRKTKTEVAEGLGIRPENLCRYINVNSKKSRNTLLPMTP